MQRIARSLLLLLCGIARHDLLAQTECDPKAAAPSAAFSASCASLACTFTLTSGVPASGVTRLDWSMGDGSASSGTMQTVSHSYAATGAYVVSLTLTAGDGQVTTTSGRVSLGPAVMLLAADDSFSTDKDTPIVISTAELLANDSAGVRFVQADPVKCPLLADGEGCTYTPPPGQTGSDSFAYSVKDALGQSASATVKVTINAPLTANPDHYSVKEGESVLISAKQLLQNDSPGAVFIRAENPIGGLLTVETAPAPDGSQQLRYTPTTCGAKTGSFEYLISWDSSPPYERGFVTIDIEPTPPNTSFTVSCVNRTCTVHPRTPLRDPAHPEAVGCPVARWLWNWGDGTPVQEPTVPYRWADQTHTYAASGRYTITHTQINTIGLAASLALEVLANTKPVAVNDTVSTERDIPVNVDMLANDTDADGDSLFFYNVQISHPSASWQTVQLPTRLGIRVTPPDTFVGTLTITYQATDRWGGVSAPATITLTVTQWTSITDALGEQFYCDQNGSLRIPIALLLSNDYDQDGDPLAITGFDTTNLMGTLDCVTDPAACSYRPPLNGAGRSVFRYTASDPAGHKDTATVAIYVGVRGSPASPQDDYFTTTRNVAKVFTIQDVLQNDFDPDGDTLTVGLISGARNYGFVSCSYPMYQCSYSPNAGFVGTDRFAYTASDVMNGPVGAAINVLTLPPQTPTFDAREDMRFANPGQQSYITLSGLAANDYDPEGDPISVASVDTSGVIGGSITCDSFGCLYKPGSYFQGTTVFRYTATDGRGSNDTAIVKIRVGSGNKVPVAAADVLSTPRNTTLRFSAFELLRNDYDLDNDPLTPTIYPASTARGTMSCDGKGYWCTYTPAANVTGDDTFTYWLGDGIAGTSSTFTIHVLP